MIYHLSDFKFTLKTSALEISIKPIVMLHNKKVIVMIATYLVSNVKKFTA